MDEPKNILLIEDQKELWPMVKDIFQSSSFSLHAVNSKSQALYYLKNYSVDLVLLDLILNDEDGKDILSFIRRQNHIIPVIILSSLCDLETRQKCFTLGADDYLIKPYVPEELLMRAQRALERKDQVSKEDCLAESLILGEITLDMDSQRLWIKKDPVSLRNKLYQMLLLFMQNPNNTIRKEMFHSILWRNELYDENSLNVHIHQLRKILKAVDNPVIKTIPKIGYRMEYNIK